MLRGWGWEHGELGALGTCQTSRRGALSDVLEDKSSFSRKGRGQKRQFTKKESSPHVQSYTVTKVWPVWIIASAAEQ